MADHTIIYEPLGRRGSCPEQDNLLACARRSGVGINSICGGMGACGGCRIRVMDGLVSPPSEDEREKITTRELQEGWRLACQTYPRGDCRLYIPPESMTTPQRTQLEGAKCAVSPDPPVQSHLLSMTGPAVADPGSDAGRLLEALNRKAQQVCDRLDIDVLRVLSPRLRENAWRCRAVVRGSEVVAVGPAAGRLAGLAVDLGSTKIAAYLVDLNSGKTLAARGAMNPQISHGEDIVSRMTCAIKNPGDAVTMRRLVVGVIGDLSAGMCIEAGLDPSEVAEAVIVGNTVMHHLLLGLPVGQLAIAPFVPVVSQAVDVKARDMGIGIAGGAYVHLLPNIAGYVGGDHVAMLLATGAIRTAGTVLLLDIGTNTEVSLISDGNIASVSCASGPAFEGGHIRDGMRAARGAIERVRISGDEVRCRTVEDAPPVGICGSGITDAVAQLYQAGIIDEGGRMTAHHPRIHATGNGREFVLVSSEKRNGGPAITVTQKDIRELQLAKAAIRAGIQALLENRGKTEEDIDKIVIAGAFGSYIDMSSAITIGMLPALSLEKFEQVGNAAGLGARMALVSQSKRDEARKIARRVNYLELAGAPYFSKTFVQASFLGTYRIVNGHRKEI